jgi:hypothetical protein
MLRSARLALATLARAAPAAQWGSSYSGGAAVGAAQLGEHLRSGGGAAPFSAQAAEDPLYASISEQLDGFRSAGTFKVERTITTPQGPSVGA